MICTICHKEFIPPHKNTKYCSELCAKKAIAIQKKEKREANRKPIPCAFCHKLFLPANGHFKYCSEQCKNEVGKINDRKYYLSIIDKRKAYRRNRYIAHKDEILAKQRAKRREDAAKQGRTVRPRKSRVTKLPPKVYFIPAAIAQNREPTLDEILDFIFKEQSS